MGKVISFVTGKGGVGKSTLSFNTAGALAEIGNSVVLIDSDNEKPDSIGIYGQAVPDNNFNEFNSLISTKSVISNLNESTIDFDIVLSKQDEFNKQVAELKNKYDYVLIDTPPNYSHIAVKSVVLSDLSFIIAAPSFSDENAVEKTFNFVDVGKPVVGILNKITLRQKLSKKLLDSVAENNCSESDEKRMFLSSIISEKVAIQQAAYTGLYVGEFDPGSKSHNEFKSLALEITGLLK